MYTKKLRIATLTLVLSANIFANAAVADDCTSLIGSWWITGEEACGVLATNEFAYNTIDRTVEILSQQGCSFYGEMGGPDDDNIVTGAIIGNTVKMTIWDVTVTARIINEYQMRFIFSDIADNENVEQCTGTGDAWRLTL